MGKAVEFVLEDTGQVSRIDPDKPGILQRLLAVDLSLQRPGQTGHAERVDLLQLRHDPPDFMSRRLQGQQVLAKQQAYFRSRLIEPAGNLLLDHIEMNARRGRGRVGLDDICFFHGNQPGYPLEIPAY
nr:hypothetical protein [Pseudomonas gingeri]